MMSTPANAANNASAASSSAVTEDVPSNIATIRTLAEAGSLLTRSQIEKLSKEQVIDYLYKRDTLSAALSSLANAFEQLTKRLDRSDASVAILKNCNQKLTEKCASLEKRLTDVERQSTNSAQYLRRRQIEVKNIPEQSNGPHLKASMSTLLSLTGETVTPADLDKCHTLGKGVIMEFASREKRDAVLRGRKNLKHKPNELHSLKMGKPMIIESLCKSYGELDYVCRSLFRSNSLEKTWFFNGRLHIEVENGDHRLISHITDLHAIFGQGPIVSILGHK